MPRIKRKHIELNENSLKELMQETYNDAHQIRSTIVALFNNWNSKVKELGEVAATGKEIVSLINALARNQDQKITLMKVLSDIIYKNNSNNATAGAQSKSIESDGETLTEEAQKSLRKMIEEAKERGELDL